MERWTPDRRRFRGVILVLSLLLTAGSVFADESAADYAAFRETPADVAKEAARYVVLSRTSWFRYGLGAGAALAGVGSAAECIFGWFYIGALNTFACPATFATLGAGTRTYIASQRDPVSFAYHAVQLRRREEFENTPTYRGLEKELKDEEVARSLVDDGLMGAPIDVMRKKYGAPDRPRTLAFLRELEKVRRDFPAQSEARMAMAIEADARNLKARDKARDADPQPGVAEGQPEAKVPDSGNPDKPSEGTRPVEALSPPGVADQP